MIEKLVDFIFELGVSFGTKLISAALIFFVGHKLVKIIKRWLSTSSKLDKLDGGVRSFLVSFAGIALYVILVITVAMTLGIPTTSFITALASCGVALGLSLQGSLSNIAGGIMLLIFKPFKVGDYITTSNASGSVSQITMVYTVLTTPDNKVITVPNGNLTNTVIENYSVMENRRVDIDFAASYDCDVDAVKGLLMDIITSHPLTLFDPEPLARVSAHGDSAIIYTVRVWCKSEDYWSVRFDLLETVKKEFDKNGIAIPFPQMDVHVDNSDIK